MHAPTRLQESTVCGGVGSLFKPADGWTLPVEHRAHIGTLHTLFHAGNSPQKHAEARCSPSTLPPRELGDQVPGWSGAGRALAAYECGGQCRSTLHTQPSSQGEGPLPRHDLQ